MVLNMARQGVDLRGIASFHGGLTAVKPAQSGMVEAKILVLNGADDKFIPAEQLVGQNEISILLLAVLLAPRGVIGQE